MVLEVCCADMESVRAAKEGGADRVELCVNLEADGLTPSKDFIEEALQTGIRVHVLIRCREGNFVYCEEEVKAMEEEVEMAVSAGCHGVVIGALTADGDVDEDTCRRLIRKAGNRVAITFHRAFDVCRDPLNALKVIESLGCHRLLTSGQAPTAYEGRELLRTLVSQQSKVIIMPGSGVTPENAHEILRYTGATEIHGTLRSVINGKKITTVDNVKRVKS